jgi:uncharacterized damage-inducible protein DinB
MEKKELLMNAWDNAYDKEGWYTPLKDALRELSPEEATWKSPGRSSHSIWELINHLLFYKERFLTYLKGNEFNSPIQSNDETFLILNTAPAYWEAVVHQLKAVHHEIRNKISILTDEELKRALPESAVDIQLMDLIVHDAYHTGQIIFIRKLYGSWPL